MKKDIHPDYHPVVFLDSTTGFKFLSGSTKHSSETIEWEDGNTYPVIRVEVTSDSHPFYLHWTSKIHTSRRTCGPFQQKIRSQRRQRCKIILTGTIIGTTMIMRAFLFGERLFFLF